MFNRSDSFGAGANFRTDQPSWLLMNNPVEDIDIWSSRYPEPVAPNPLPYSSWLARFSSLKISDNDYTSRAMAGRYLSHGFNMIASNLPENVSGKYIVGEVVDLSGESGKYSISLQVNGPDICNDQPGPYDHILLATGHPEQRESKETALYRTFADRHPKTGFIPSVYPAETAFSDLPPQCTVGIKGMGLTFVDAVLALTEGKGGRFDRDENTDTLTYTPSGREPEVIYPFSRSGLPMIPRQSVPIENNELICFTGAALQKFEPGKQLDFNREIWPLLKQDMICSYYDISLKNRGHPKGLSGCDRFEDAERCIGEYHKTYRAEPHFDVDRFLDPLQEMDSYEHNTIDPYIKSLYKYYLDEARKGELKSALAAVTAVWRKASSLFCEVYSFGGLTPESQRYFDSSIRGKLNRVTFGPPVRSAEKLYALMESGILNFKAARDPDLILDHKSGSFILQSGPDNPPCPVRYLVDARIPKNSPADNPGPLFRNLLNRGLITIYENCSGEEAYRTGAVNISRRGYVIDKEGFENQRIAATGTPTEGITFDNDTLSRDRNNIVDGWAECVSIEYAKSRSGHYAN